MVRCVGIDVGRDSVKVVSGDSQICFKSRVGEWRDLRISLGGKYDVEVDGEKFFIADLTEESYFGRSMAVESKIHLETKVLFLSALALMVKEGSPVRVSTGIPISQYHKCEKESLFNLLKGEHVVVIENRRVELTVDSLGIIPEGSGVYWDSVLNSSGELNTKDTDGVFRVVDIGSRTINYCTIINKKFLDRESGTLGYGTLAYENALNDCDFVESVKREFVRRVLGDLSRKWMSLNFRKDKIIVAGGGSSLFKKELLREIPGIVVSESPLFANARGFYKNTVANFTR